MKREYFYIAIGLILIGTIVFTSVSNRSLRQAARELKKQNAELHESNDVLHKQNAELEKDVVNKDGQIKEGIAVYDSLKIILQKLNDQKIYVSNGTHLTNLDFDGEISYLSGYINKINSGN